MVVTKQRHAQASRACQGTGGGRTTRALTGTARLGVLPGEVTMATLERPIELAARAHAGQRDKEGLPYILHALRVMMNVGPGAQVVAVLHDTLEDTDLTEDDLRREGFSEEVIAAVKAVTRGKRERYSEYVVRAS